MRFFFLLSLFIFSFSAFADGQSSAQSSCASLSASYSSSSGCFLKISGSPQSCAIGFSVTGNSIFYRSFVFTCGEVCPSPKFRNPSTQTCDTPPTCNSTPVIGVDGSTQWQTYDPNTHICVDNSVNCPPPTTVNLETKSCEVPPPPTCSGGQVVYLPTNTCVNPSCPPGQIFRSDLGACAPNCVGGQTYDVVSHACDSPTCYAPQVLNQTTQLCETPPPSCVSPSVFNSATGACETPPPPDPNLDGDGNPNTNPPSDPNLDGDGNPNTNPPTDPNLDGDGNPNTNPPTDGTGTGTDGNGQPCDLGTVGCVAGGTGNDTGAGDGTGTPCDPAVSTCTPTPDSASATPGSGNCSSAPSCSGDPVGCASIQQSWALMCADSDLNLDSVSIAAKNDVSDIVAGDMKGKSLSDLTVTSDVSTKMNDALNTARSSASDCPIVDSSFTFKGATVVIPFSKACIIQSYVRWSVIASFSLISILILVA